VIQAARIFVPKIPSMSTTDLARSMAPQMPQKDHRHSSRRKAAHEIMIPADDARQTMELDDRYVILPSFFAIQRELYAHGAGRCARTSPISSDANPERLDARACKRMLAETFA